MREDHELEPSDAEIERFADEWLEHKMTASPSTRRGFVRGIGGAVLTMGVSGVLSACGGSSNSSSSSSADTGGRISGDLRILDVAGYEDPSASGPFRRKYPVKVQAEATGSNEEIVSKLAGGGTRTYSLASPNVAYVQNMVAANLLAPADYEKVAATKEFLPFIARDSVSAVSVDGKPYAFPFIWGDSPLMYNEKYLKGPAPESWMDLTSQRFKKKLFLVDDPSNNITVWSRAHGFDPKTLTKDQLKTVTDFLVNFKQNQVRTFGGTWEDVTSLMVSGDILAVASGGWSAVPDFIAQKGGKAASIHAKEGDFVWNDTWAVPKYAPNVAAAYGWINTMLGAKAQAILARKLLSGTVNSQAVSSLGSADKKLYNYKNPTQVSKGLLYLPPPKANGDQASLNDWYKAWQTVKAA